MKYSNIPSAQSVVLHCRAKGIQDIVISPGSRNAPLTIGFTEDPYFKCYSIVDERCAAFFALGIAQQLQKPVVVLCTSGSALLNYYPGIAEAFYSNIPLIAISADRPLYKIDVGDGQTIRQDHVFDRHIGYSANLRQDVGHSPEKVKKYAADYVKENDWTGSQERIQTFNDAQLNLALNTAINKKLPVHINVPFEEPLYDKIDKPSVNPEFVFENPAKAIESDNWNEIIERWNTSKRKMVLVGVSYPNMVNEVHLNQLGKDPSVVVLTETTSNIHHPNFFPSIDSIIAPIEKLDEKEELYEALRPEILLTFGGLIVSKKIKAFLRKYKPKMHCHVGEHRANNTFYALSHHIESNINPFFDKLLMKRPVSVKSEYHAYWNSIKTHYTQKRDAYLKSAPFSDLLVFQKIFQNVPGYIQLQMSNSSAIRYAQLFNVDPNIEMFCNRGASGIDGSVSTAIGASITSKKQVVMITGDLSFFYDSNALWNNYIPTNFRIIVINNEGGGIFKILPGQEETPNFKTYFETAHHLNAEHICKMYGLDYACVNEENSLKDELKEFFASTDMPKLLEIKTPRLLNNKILLGYFDFISSDIINHIH